jgi:transposase
MDTAMLLKRQEIKTVIPNAGHMLEYLPSYSPDLNDIEPQWAQAKAIKRRTDVPSSSSLPLMKFKTLYIGSAIS